MCGSVGHEVGHAAVLAVLEAAAVGHEVGRHLVGAEPARGVRRRDAAASRNAVDARLAVEAEDVTVASAFLGADRGQTSPRGSTAAVGVDQRLDIENAVDGVCVGFQFYKHSVAMTLCRTRIQAAIIT